ncbi:MAG: hypothetical protein EAY65_06470 [Alphaproteobacteria bacterium]|nr:MAG: hypothetical protein EAY65_06470 [Alphaproteobacteria bacterium]
MTKPERDKFMKDDRAQGEGNSMQAQVASIAQTMLNAGVTPAESDLGNTSLPKNQDLNRGKGDIGIG